MHLLSCENPQRVYNKYIDEYVWVPCGKCNTCRNMKASRWTEALERERAMHRYCMFVTLTYDDYNLPKVNLGYYGNEVFSLSVAERCNVEFLSSRLHDDICIPFQDFKLKHASDEEKDLFMGIYRQFGGIPYASYSDIQYFHKRLNKWFYQNVTNKFGNFRFFTVSEFGSTTLRPHFHSIYYVDDQRVAERFAEGVCSCWKLGITDTKYVESSACAYVAQYVNKFSDLPLFYKETKLKPKYWFSKFPIIGVEDFDNTQRIVYDDSENMQKIFDQCLVEVCFRRKASATDFSVRPLHKSVENRLFPKCPFFSKISYSCRIELYNIASRFGVENYKRPFEVFRRKVMAFLDSIYSQSWVFQRNIRTEFSDFLNEMFYKPFMSDDECLSERAYGWLRRLYYMSRKVLRNMLEFNVNLSTYVERIIEYYNKKELWLLKKFYSYQSAYEGISDDLALMYPEYLYSLGFIRPRFYCKANNEPVDVRVQRSDGAFYAYSNKKTHFKNAYLDSLAFKDSYYNLFINLKKYYYAQKCNETFETIAA